MTDAPIPAVTRDSMRADIARALRMPPEELQGDDDLDALGLDSMRTMNLMLSWAEAGLQLDFGELAEVLTLDSWWAAAERARAKRMHG